MAKRKIVNIEEIKVLQASVVKRFLSPEEFEKFAKKYQESRVTSGQHRIGRYKKAVVTEKDIDFLRRFLTDGKVSSMQLMRETGMGTTNASIVAAPIALRIIARNLDLLGVKEDNE